MDGWLAGWLAVWAAVGRIFAAKNIKSKQASQESERQRIGNAHTYRSTQARVHAYRRIGQLQHEASGGGRIAVMVQVKTGPGRASKKSQFGRKKNTLAKKKNTCARCFLELAEECDIGDGGRVSSAVSEKIYRKWLSAQNAKIMEFKDWHLELLPHSSNDREYCTKMHCQQNSEDKKDMQLQ